MKPGERLSKEPSHSPTDIYLYAYVLDLTQSGDIGHALDTLKSAADGR